MEDLAKTEASRLFVTRRFAEALDEFKKLSRQYPKDIVVKRYIGACLDYLRRDEEALAAFSEVLSMNQGDLPSRQFLGKIYLRRGDLDQAEEHFSFIVSNDRQGTFAPFAQRQLTTIRNLKEAAKRAAQAPAAGRQLSVQDFLKTQAAQAFVNAKYDKALEEFLKLEQTYPQDTTIKRYQGLTLDKLGRYDEAIATFQSGLSVVPNNIPIHYFLAQSYIHKRDFTSAQKEFEYVTENDESSAYKIRAQQELAALLKILELLKPPRKWSFNTSCGAEWNSNPTSGTTVPEIATGHIPSSWKFSNTAGGSYSLFRKGAWSGKATYSYSQSLYSASLDQLNTFSNNWGASATYTRMIKGKPLTVQAGQSTAYTLVHHDYYSTGYTENLAFIYPFKDWQRLTVSDRWTYTSYAHDGTDADITSRDGFGNVASITNDFYLNQAKNLSLLFNFEYGRDATQGTNYRKNTFTGKTGIHFPILFKFEGDLSFKFKDAQFPKSGFPASSPTRRDEEYGLSATLTRPLSRHWFLSSNYSYTNVVSLDDNFTYKNNALGITLSYNY